MAKVSLLELLSIFNSLLDISISNKLSTKRDLTNIIRSKSCIVWFVLLSYRISKRESIRKDKSTKSILSIVFAKIVGNT